MSRVCALVGKPVADQHADMQDHVPGKQDARGRLDQAHRVLSSDFPMFAHPLALVTLYEWHGL